MARGGDARRRFVFAGLIALPAIVAWWAFETFPSAHPPRPAAAADPVPSFATEVQIVKREESPVAATAIAPADPSTPPAFEFVKPDEVAIEGKVVAPGGEPVEGAQVFVQIDVTSPMPRTVRAHTGRDGRFRVAAPPTKPVVLRIVTHTAPAHGFRWPVARVQVPAGGKKDLIVRLETGETIEGRVVDAFGNGIPGLHLRTRVPRAMSAGAYVAAAAVTGLDGSFSLDGLPSGFATVVEVRQSGSVREHVLVDAEDVPTGTTGLRVLRLPVVSVSGRVVDAAGNAVAKRTVVLARKGAALVVESRTDDDGRFVASVAAPGEYVVRLRFATQSGHADRAMGELHTASGYEKTFVAPK